MGAPTASSLASGSTTTLSKRPEDKEADPEVQQGRMDTIAEGTEVDDVFGAQGGEKTVNYRRCAAPPPLRRAGSCPDGG